MGTVRVAINGFGRIGRHACKIISNTKGMELVTVNDLTDSKTLAHLLKYDTAYPDFSASVSHDDAHIIINKKKVPVCAEKDPAALPWKKYDVDVVLECTGRFTKKEDAAKHIAAGARRVVISAPVKGGEVPTFVIGVNEHEYAGQEVVSNASCTTNCAAPVMKVLDEVFGIENAMLTTVHSYTASQPLQDAPSKDLREARAAAQNMVPATTGAAIATGLVLPQLSGKFDGLSVRVPTITVSLLDITAVLKTSVTKDELNMAFLEASKGALSHVLAVSSEPLVSSDFVGSSYSATVDLPLSYVVGGNLVKVIAWYDNEWGYANRLVELSAHVARF